MFARLRRRAPWWAIGLVLLLPALGGGYSLLFGWPFAVILFVLVFGLMLTNPENLRQLPWWYWTLVAGLAAMGAIWLWPGDGLVFLSPTRRDWPGPSGTVARIACDLSSTQESLFLAAGFVAVLGICLIAMDRPQRRRVVMRWMIVCVGLVFAVAMLIHFLRLPICLMPDVPVLYWNRLSYPLTGANLSAAFFISCLPFGLGLWTVFSAEERYLPVRRVWQVVGLAMILTLLALQLMTQNRWMWLVLSPFLLAGLVWLMNRKRSRRRRLLHLLYLTVFVVTTLIFLSYFDPGSVIHRFLDLTESDESTVTRSTVWRGGLNTFTAYPWVGVGLGSFGEVSPTTAPAGINLWPRYAHSEPIQWLAETGVLGSLLLATVVAGMIMTAWRQIRNRQPWLERMPFALSTLLLVGATLVDFPLRCPAILFLFAMYLGTALGRDRTTAELVAETAIPVDPTLAPAVPTAATAPTTEPTGRTPPWIPVALGCMVTLAGLWLVLPAQALFGRAVALTDFEYRRRNIEKDPDLVALASSAESVFKAANRHPRWSAEAIQTILAGSNDNDRLNSWDAAVEDILEDCPYHDTLYYFRARVSFHDGNLDQAARQNALARRCAATNRESLRKIAELDWGLAQSTEDPTLRAERLAHAQETTRWLLSGSPGKLQVMANTCESLSVPLDDFLPSIPADWANPGALCQVCLDRDRPLTALTILNDNDLYGRAESLRKDNDTHAGLTRFDLAVLAATGQSQAIEVQFKRLYKETPIAGRATVVAEVVKQGWGLLTPDQWKVFCDMVEESLPGAKERLQLGYLYLRMGKRGDACQCFLKSYKAERLPGTAAALARLYLQNSAWSAAIDYALDWTQLESKNPAAWRFLAAAGIAARDFDTAKKAFDRYKSLDPKGAEADFVMHGMILRKSSAGSARDSRTPK